MPRRRADGTVAKRKSRRPNIKTTILREKRAERKSLKAKLREIERDLRSLLPRKRNA
jgi:hypothetical protein